MNKSIYLILLSILVSCSTKAQQEGKTIQQTMGKTENLAYATFGGGCFWCTEAIFDQLEGVVSVASGYSGGHIKNPGYREVTTGRTGHAEVIQITFDPKVISFNELLDIFFSTHDPTTLNRQGADKGTQYRSAVFYHNENQKRVTEEMILALDQEKVFPNKIVTEVTAFDAFYEAEEYHQDYYVNNKYQGYCQVVINPKLEKFQKKYKSKLKKH